MSPRRVGCVEPKEERERGVGEAASYFSRGASSAKCSEGVERAEKVERMWMVVWRKDCG